MKNYTITVNGTVYDVTVEEGGAGSAPVRAAAPASKAAPAAPAAPAPAAAPAGDAGSIEVSASVPGKVFKVEANVGQTVKSGDPIIILEAMKMENEIMAPADGTVTAVHVAQGATVQSGDPLVSM